MKSQLVSVLLLAAIAHPVSAAPPTGQSPAASKGAPAQGAPAQGSSAQGSSAQGSSADSLAGKGAPAQAAKGKNPAPAPKEFATGQVWAYETRPQDKGSTYTVIKVIDGPKGKIVNVRIDGVKIRNEKSPTKLSTTVGHVPVMQSSLAQCTLNQIRTGASIPKESIEGYALWKREFDKGRAGAFNAPLSIVVQGIEANLNQK